MDHRMRALLCVCRELCVSAGGHGLRAAIKHREATLGHLSEDESIQQLESRDSNRVASRSMDSVLARLGCSGARRGAYEQSSAAELDWLGEMRTLAVHAQKHGVKQQKTLTKLAAARFAFSRMIP